MSTRRNGGVILGLLGLALLPLRMPGQTRVGQYEDEAPMGSWNAFAVPSSISLGMGGAGLAHAADPLAAAANPALLVLAMNESRWGVSLGLREQRATFFRYGPVNTGPLSAPAPLTLSKLAIDAVSVSARFGSWAAALIYTPAELYDRPSHELQLFSQPRGILYYEMRFEQRGRLDDFCLALARAAGRWTFGLGLHAVSGSLSRSIVEHDYYPTDLTIEEKKQSLRGIFFEAGLSLRLGPRAMVGLACRAPYTRRADTRSQWRFEPPAGGTTVEVSGGSADRYPQPLVVGIGGWVEPFSRLGLAADLVYLGWSHYRATVYGEEQQRNFRDVLVFRVGVEYALTLRRWQKRFSIPLRAGFQSDPQPMKTPDVVYRGATVGFGLHWPTLHLDAAGFFGSESGSGNPLHARCLTLTVSFHPRKAKRKEE